ncbi:hypothetical protein D3C85_1902290 [compost metagenome]
MQVLVQGCGHLQLYYLVSKQDVIELIREFIDQEKYSAAIYLLEIIQQMEEDNRTSVLITVERHDNSK